MKKNNSKKNSRRDFIKHGTLAASSFFIVPRYVLGGNGFTSPSDKINIAGIVLAVKEHLIFGMPQMKEKKMLLLYVMSIREIFLLNQDQDFLRLTFIKTIE